MRGKHILIAFATLCACAQQQQQQPQPKAVDPGKPAQAPSDAVALFDGKDLSKWVHRDGRPAQWFVRDGTIVCKSGSGDILSKQKFGSAQIHVEFNIPNMPAMRDQAKGNSGVYVQGRYEIQVLDSYQNPTYPDGSCGAVYGQHAPLVNASRPPEQWQSYDMIFHAAKCAGGKVAQQGTITILQNGVLIQDHVTLKGATPGGIDQNVCAPGPLLLQDHYHPDVKETFMKFRNVWVRPLSE